MLSLLLIACTQPATSVVLGDAAPCEASADTGEPADSAVIEDTAPEAPAVRVTLIDFDCDDNIAWSVPSGTPYRAPEILAQMDDGSWLLDTRVSDWYTGLQVDLVCVYAGQIGGRLVYETYEAAE